ncbi:hypothetical protein [Bacteroides sp. 224]|uniref:TolB family protein n=1 Tax=Bacteroides sp. 224 TaxID=2302936 RepID=UPI0013D07F78|nr:hypothetical protein [Bacteroides sp. 224]NDV65935.1 hypothetical protein [Bacteroides sp. 224]
MLSYKQVIVLFAFSAIANFLHAQFVNYGTDPYKYKWNIVNTNHFKIVYPQGNDSTAYRYATLLETAYPYVQQTIGNSKDRKFPVILHPGNMLSNGMVSWAPRRMEIITTPSSDLYAQQWDRQLVLHESRHLFQTNKVIRGIFKPLYYGLGEQAAGVASFLLPTWFLEGDAVATETALSNSGRGRLPEFNMIYRAQMLSNDFYSFDKWFLGSYKNYTGSKYAFGYNLTAFARHQYGADVWNKVTARYADRILNLPPFSNALKHHTGIRPQKLFQQTFSFLNEEWNIQEKEYQQSGFSPTPISPVNKEYTEYKYAQSLNDSTVIAVKSNLSELNSLISLINGKEKRITYLGNINSRITLNNNKVYWSEYVSGLRWTHQNYSVIKCLDLETKKTTTLTSRQRYLTPAVDSTNKKIAASCVSTAGKNRIVLVNAENGNEITTFDTPQNAFAKEIAYAGDNRIIAILIDSNGINIQELDINTGKWKERLKPTWANISSPIWTNDKLYFESGLNGTNNIYCLEDNSSNPYQITSARFGAFTPSLSSNEKDLIFSDYQSTGYQIASVPINKLQKKQANFNNPYKHKLAETISQQENFNLDTATIASVEFKPKRYYRLPHLFKIHSWAPFYYDVSDVINLDTDDISTIVKPGATILSQNTLNTSIAQAGWYYKDNYHHGKLAFTYMGWYPVVDLSVDYGAKAFTMSWTQNEETGKESIRGRYTDRNLIEAEARVYIPFNLTRNHYTRGFQPSVTYYYTNNEYQQFNSRKYRNFQYMLSELRFYNYRKMAKRDILPRWGYQLRLQHIFSPFNSENYGHLYAARLTTYLPGIINNNGLMLRFGYQFQDLDDKALYLPKRIMTEPRGYNYLYSTRQLMTFSADYSFSIISPDFSLGSLMYIRRVRSNAFYDLYRNQASKKASWNTQSSYGLDVILDCNLLQIEFPISLGARIINPINYGKLQAEALFSISF